VGFDSTHLGNFTKSTVKAWVIFTIEKKIFKKRQLKIIRRNEKERINACEIWMIEKLSLKKSQVCPNISNIEHISK